MCTKVTGLYQRLIVLYLCGYNCRKSTVATHANKEQVYHFTVKTSCNTKFQNCFSLKLKNNDKCSRIFDAIARFTKIPPTCQMLLFKAYLLNRDAPVSQYSFCCSQWNYINLSISGLGGGGSNAGMLLTVYGFCLAYANKQ